MRKNFILPGLCLFLIMFCSNAYCQWISPESAVYDSVHHRYLISDQGTGCISAVDTLDNITIFNCSFSTVKGLMIRNDTLFCCASQAGLGIIDLETGALLTTVYFFEMSDLNDVTGDTSGNIYVSDPQGSKVHRLHLEDMSTELIVDDFPWANGMVFDTADNRILICQWITDAPLVAINLDDYSLDTVRHDHMYLLDGLAWDLHGNLYVSSWGDGKIYAYKAGFSEPPLEISSGYGGPADIAFNYRDTVLAIPNTTAARVDYLRLFDPDNDFIFNEDDNCPLHFNPSQEDTDADLHGDSCDNCIETYNPDQLDSDGDSIGDVCEGCCVELAGNADCSEIEEPDISDITRLIDYLYISHDELCCPEEADSNGSGGEPDIADITALISYLYIDHTPLAACP